MDPSLNVHVAAFQRALDDFRSKIAPHDSNEFKNTTLEDLQRSILGIQQKHTSDRKTKNMTRLKSFLEGMEQYGKVIEVFLNASELLAFVWGPMKFLLQVASNFAEAFDELLDVYNDIGESLPLLAQYESLSGDNGYIGKILEMIYIDILKFHQKAYKYFKQHLWKQLFKATWKTFRSRFKPVVEDLRRHKNLISAQTSLCQFEEVQRIRIAAEAESRIFRKAEELRRLGAVQDWLLAANMDEDHEVKASVRAEYPGVCSWILNHNNVQYWRDLTQDSQPSLWINGIPGAGKTTIASFLIEQLRKIESAHVFFFYCKHEDPSRNSFAALARTMIGQAVSRNTKLLPYVYEEAATCGERPLKSLKLSQEILATCLKSMDNVYIIIDGLDECPPSEKKTIASWFQAFAQSALDEDLHSRCLFVSQNDRETSKFFKDVSFVQITSENLASDINSFCKIEGEKIKSKFALSEAESEKVVQKVCHEAKDMFLYAKLVMKNLLGQTRLANLRKEMEPGRFPHGIDQAYGRIVNRILDAESTEREDAILLLGLLVCAKRSLKWAEIQGAISIDLNQKIVDFENRCFRVDSKDLCGSLVEIRPGGTVELVHMTAKYYLIHQKYLNLNKENLSLSHLCLEYLSMHCFDNGLPESLIQEFVMSGHYAFAEYAVAHWSEHLLNAFQHLDSSDLESLAHIIEAFLTKHFSTTTPIQSIPIGIEKPLEKLKAYVFYDSLGQAISVLEARKNSNSRAQIPTNNLDLEDVLSQVRSTMKTMHSSFETRQMLEKFHGCNLFKCSRIECTAFFEGFSNEGEYLQHQTRHVRGFYCTFEGCVAAQSGFTSSKDLQRHLQSLHDDSGVLDFPCYRDPSLAEAKKSIEESDISVFERYLKVHCADGKLLSFSRYDTMSKPLWQTAINHPNEEVFILLILHTKFQDTDAQQSILRCATHARKIDIVRRFVGDEFRRQQFNGGLAWDRAILAAISLANVDILRVLVNTDVSRLNPKGIKRVRYHLIEACRSGGISCVQYFVSELGWDPFQHERSPIGPIQSSNRDHRGRALRKNRGHSPLYNAIETGQKSIIQYLLGLEDNQNFTKPESREVLLEVTASNGFEDILDMLVATDKNNVDGLVPEKYAVQAQLYHAVRSGKEDLVKELLPLSITGLDLPDRNGCSMLMYAALHGLEYTVDYLLQNGADVMRQANCQEVSSSSAWDQTALVLATFNGHTPIVRRLLKCPGIETRGWVVFPKGHEASGLIQSIERVVKIKGYTAISDLLEEWGKRKAV